MPRAKGYSGEIAHRRETLEDAMACLVRIEILIPLVRLRAQQARGRSGLGALLFPALDDLDEIAAAIQRAKRQVSKAALQVCNSVAAENRVPPCRRGKRARSGETAEAPEKHAP